MQSGQRRTVAGRRPGVPLAGDGADTILGSSVGDQLYFDNLDTVVNGGGGFDYAYAHNSPGINVISAAQQLESAQGSSFNDALNAGKMTTTAYLLGNAGSDRLSGGAAGDQLFCDHEDSVDDGGPGYDFAYAYNVGFTPVTVNLLFQQLEEVWGGFGGDTLNGAGMATTVVLVGLDGADTLTGGNANDTLSAGTGDDLLKGNAGNDTIFGEGGTGDVAVYDGVAGDYSWGMIGANVYTLTHTASGAVDTIYIVEFLRFTGGGADVPI